jgi:hypothetical protein
MRNLFTEQGHPRYVRCYDNGGESLDRYTIVFSKIKGHLFVSSSAMPFNPLGFYQHGEGQYCAIDYPTCGHLGKKIAFDKLPDDVQKAVMQDYIELWTPTKKELNQIN